MSSHENLIKELSRNLSPVKPPISINLISIVWLLFTITYVVAITNIMGPIRSTALTQLISKPQFLLETLFGLVAITFIALTAFRAAVPGALNQKFTLFSISLFLLWIVFYIVGLVSPAIEPSMLGKRDHCVIETFIYSLLPIVVAFILTLRLYPLKPMQSAFFFSLAAGMVPALYMQVACMYSPTHILQFHIFPGALIAILGASLAFIYKKDR